MTTTQVFEFNIFQIIPNTFIGVQVGSIARQLFQMKLFGRALAQKIFDRLAAMGRQTIPDEQQVTLKVTPQMLEKADNIWSSKSLLLGPGEQFSVVAQK